MGSIAALLPLLISILEAAPVVMDDVKKVWHLATTHTAPTADEQKAFDDALDAAHEALQAS